MTESNRHDVPLEPDSQPGRRSGRGAESVLPHLQQQVQISTPAEPVAQPAPAGESGTPAEPD